MKKTRLIPLILASAALFFLLALCPVADAHNLYSSLIRIHVLANSDSREDQAQKLAVRDRILAYTKEELELGSNRENARKALEEHLDELAEVARKTLSEQGTPRDVRVSITEEYYPTREYENLSLPAGNYLSLQIQIGNAEGKNWWCVLFPPLCLSSATETEDALAGAGMNEENIATVTRKEKSYRVRFKILELFGKAKKSLQEVF